MNGQEAENIALNYLIQQGLTLVEQNYRSPRGEIDIILSHEKTLIFTEVRFRSNKQFGGAIASITQQKKMRIQLTAEYFLTQHKKYKNFNARFDVVGISPGTPEPELDWIPNAFDAVPA